MKLAIPAVIHKSYKSRAVSLPLLSASSLAKRHYLTLFGNQYTFPTMGKE